MVVTVKETAELLMKQESITLLCHERPDGDTLGSAFALYHCLIAAGRKARVLSPDGYPEKYSYMYKGYSPEPADPSVPEFIVSVDVGDASMLGRLREQYADRVRLCIDHHACGKTMGEYALVHPECAATGELIILIMRELGSALTMPAAVCLYTALATDTGVFRYSNTTAQTLRMAADLVEFGVDAAGINDIAYGNKPRRRIAAEAMLLNGIEYFFDGRCAMIFVTKEMREQTGVDDFDLEDIPTIPRFIEGVDCGVTVREDDGSCRISVRTNASTDASAVCAAFNGGGHIRAAGCTIPGSVAEVKEKLLKVIGELLV